MLVKKEFQFANSPPYSHCFYTCLNPSEPCLYGMKMTLHIDENLLAEVMESHEFETKTEAIDFALRDLDRRKKLRAFMKRGL